jgi:NitT/TauT family transport system substrate-binding protein
MQTIVVVDQISQRWSWILMCVALLGGCTSDDSGGVELSQGDGTAPIKKVQLALNWFPEAEHGGFYAAQANGFYRKRGVAVEILGGGPDAPVMQRVASGQVAFGITNADGVLNARVAGADVVALMAPYQINPRCIVVHESSGIHSIEQLSNLTLALSQRPAFSHFLRWKYNFPGVTVVPYGGVTPLVANPEYAMQGYLFSEPVIARQHGAKVRALLVADTGFNPYASVLITTREIIEKHPDLARALTEASVEGWLHYLENPQETNTLIQQLNPEIDMEVLREGARQSVPLVIDKIARAHGVGHMESARWALLLEQMIACGLIADGALELSGTFTTAFLPAAAIID